MKHYSISESFSSTLLLKDSQLWDKDTDHEGQGDTPREGFTDESDKWELLGTHKTSNLDARVKENENVTKKDSYLWLLDKGLKVLTQIRIVFRQTSSLNRHDKIKHSKVFVYLQKEASTTKN